ncbi:type I polyketide synthase [Bordetella genomosp. 1]|uniref:Beta-ketoacyl synthase n=1 Tax=Bordetella genomosp. 1 TaxID=1395607 RepID=A0ABX4EZP7_9BORD|nr:type I polyketide synthase [Bordetella genomosp. 1]OZI64234.1 beta-ketoacyl synthase [Bordetella genomosp. 1]
MAKRVAVVGMSFRFPSTNTSGYWEDLLAGKDLVTEIDRGRWSPDRYFHPSKQNPGTAYTRSAGTLGDISGFDADFFGISPREAAVMDPQQRLLLELCWETMEDAAIAPQRLRGSDCGVYIGISTADYAYRMAHDLDLLDSSVATGNTSSIAANRLSYVFDLRGPSMAVDTACSSALVAFHQAVRAVQTGECTHAIAGGVSLHLHPFGFITFSKASMLSPRGRCSVFDASGDGYVRSEGGGLFLLKDYEQALADGDRIIGVVAGSAVNTDGKKSGLTVPSPQVQAQLLEQAYARAGIDPAQLDYLEAHGTGTRVGDPIETRAIGMALGARRPGDQPLPIGSVKSNLGHLEAASGVAGLVKALHALRHREVPATIGITEINPNIDCQGWNIDIVTQNRKLRPAGTLTIGVNSFGFGGANAHVILQSAPEPVQEEQPAPTPAAELPVVVSARSEAALAQAARELAAQLRAQPQRFYDIAWQTSLRREWHAQRALVFGRDPETVATLLEQHVDGNAPRHRVAAGTAVPDASGVVFAYSGNGSQWLGMGQRLMRHPVFAQAVEAIDQHFAPLAGYRLADELQRQDAPSRYDSTEFAQPALFAVQVGITHLLATRGVRPSAVLGHSVGEVAAAWASGALTLRDAAHVIYQRSRLQGTTRGVGAMTAVGMNGNDAQAMIDAAGLSDSVCVAGYNSVRGATLAGDPAGLARIEADLKARRQFQRRLDLDYAFHSSAMDGIEAELREVLGAIAPQPVSVPMISTVTGAPVAGPELTAQYWWDNVRRPVRFEQALAALTAQGQTLYLEIGPHPVLRGYLNDALKEADLNGRALTTAARGEDDPQRILDAAAQAIVAGAVPHWHALLPRAGRPVTLPAYPWQRERHWIDETPESHSLLGRHDLHPLLGHALPQQDWQWESRLDTARHAPLADHVVGEAAVFPGAGFAEVALAAAARLSPQSAVLDVEDLEIRVPLLLDGEQAHRLRTELDPADASVRILGRATGSDGAWTLHATARALTQTADGLLDLAAPAVPERMPDFDHGLHAELTRNAGLDYGPHFSLVSHGWLTDGDTVLAQLDAPLDDAVWQGLLLHPGSLDCTFQLIIMLMREHAHRYAGMTFVPARMGRITVRAGAAAPRWVRARLLRRNPHSLTAEFELFDAEGNAVAAIRQARFRSVRLGGQGLPALHYLQDAAVAAPHPLASPAAPAPDAALLARLLDVPQETRERLARYTNEVEPLLYSLSEQFGLEALRELAEPDGQLPAVTVTRLRERARDAAPLFDHLLRLGTDAGWLAPTTAGWRLTPQAGDEGRPSAQDIWTLLSHDYPDDFTLMQACARTGMALPALLRGETQAGDVEGGFSPAAAQTAILGRAGQLHWQQSVAEAVHAAQARLPAGARLRVLEIGGCGPELGAACCAALDFDRADYLYLATQPDATDAAAGLLERWPQARVQPAGEAVPPAHYDLVFVHTACQTLAQSQAAVAAACAAVAPHGLLGLTGNHPDGWLDLVFGARAEWWAESQDGSAIAALQPAAHWQAALQAAGQRPLLAPDAIEAGPYLIWSQPEAQPRAATTPAPATADAPRAWLILADDAGAAWAEGLQARLAACGDQAILVRDVQAEPQAVAASLAMARETAGALHGVIHADGLAGDGAGDDDAAHARLARQQRRVTLAALVAQACEPLAAPVDLVLLTRGAMQYLTGAAGQDDDAALWGFGRTLQNEAANFTVRQIDLPAAAPAGWDALVRELRQPTDEPEVLLGAQGERHAVRLRQVEAPRAAAAGADDAVVRLGLSFPGQLRNLRWERVAATAPDAHQIEVDVQATGLNFRDVMYALGMLSDEAIEQGFAGPTLGLEFAGTVRRVGAAVADYRPGDRVVGFGPASFSNRVLTTADAISPIPRGLSAAAAATIPSTFFTVYYALHHLARLEEGERILIHGAAGGVGIAAIQFAQAMGAEVHATAGTPEKRDFLRLLGVTHIYDSRALTYADEILAATEGAGVDVVLNSLAGEAINRNFAVLKPFGRFLELGKRDFYENTRIGLRPFRNNISYFGIDADQLMRERPALTRRLFGEMMALFERGTLRPLPYRTFEARDLVEAFRHMQQARQIGKIVVTYDAGLPPIESGADAGAPWQAAADASYLVTGGLRGFGLRTAQWLAERGARHLVLCSRSGPADAEAQAAIAALRAQGVTVLAEACDVTDAAALAALLERVRASLPPLRGVVHAAMVLDDGLVRSLDGERIGRVLAPKLLGALHLDALTRDCPLDFFVCYSSATTQFGNPGQGNYVAANTWLEAFTRQRRARGLPATAVLWGAIDDAGYLARNTQIKDALASRMGGRPLPAALALQALGELLRHGASGLGVLELDWQPLARFLPAAGTPRYAELALAGGGADSAAGDDISHLLATLDDEALHERVVEMVKREVGEILRVAPERIDALRSVYDMGLDSLMGVELVVALEQRFGQRLPVMALSESATIDKLGRRLVVLLRGEDAAPVQPDLSSQIEHVVAQHAVDVPMEAIVDFATQLEQRGSGDAPRLIR